MSKLTQSVSAFIFAVVVVLLPMLAVPFTGVSAGLQKGDLAMLGLGVALMVAAAVALLYRRAFTLSFPSMLLAALPLPAVALVSALVNQTSLMSWWGVGLEFGTIGSAVLYAGAIFAGGLLPPAPARFLLHAFIAATACAGVVAGVAVALFGDSSTLGSWPELSAAIAAALLSATLLFDWSEALEGGQWRLLFESAVLGVCFLLFFNTVFALSVIVLLVVALLIQFAAFAAHVPRMRAPLLSCITALVLLAALFFGMQSPLLSVPPDIRPSLVATELVGGPLYFSSLKGALLGSGPNTFSQVWNKYRPNEFNTTPLWSTSFEQGYSSAATLAVTLGGLGLFAWLIPLLLFIFSAFRRLAMPGVIARMRTTADMFAGTTAVVLFYFAASFFYTTGITVFLLCGVMLGLAIHILQSREVPAAAKGVALPVRIVAAVCLVTAGAASMYMGWAQLASGSYHASGYDAFKTGDYQKARTHFASAAWWWGTPLLYSDASRVSFIILENAIASSSPGKPVPSAQMDEPVNYATHAVILDRRNFDAALSLSSLYVSYAGNKVPGADVLASSTLAAAEVLAPNRPEVPYLRAVLALELGKADEVRQYLAETFTLKPDYAPALQLKASLEARAQTPPQTEEASSTEPGV